LGGSNQSCVKRIQRPGVAVGQDPKGSVSVCKNLCISQYGVFPASLRKLR
jgi:hypothetical protein